MALILDTPPAVLPVTVDEAKVHERIDLNYLADDTSIESMLYTATRLAEEFTRRAFITQTWIYQTSCITRNMELPRPRLQVVNEVSFINWTDDVTTVIDDDLYFIDTVFEPGRLIFKSNAAFPFWYWTGWGGYPPGVLNVEFDAGYGDTADDVPFPIKEGILQIFGHLYENREGQPLYPGSFAYDLLSPFQIFYL